MASSSQGASEQDAQVRMLRAALEEYVEEVESSQDACAAAEEHAHREEMDAEAQREVP